MIATVERFEVIDWTTGGLGRAFTKFMGMEVSTKLQDDGKTLKVFLKDKRTPSGSVEQELIDSNYTQEELRDIIGMNNPRVLKQLDIEEELNEKI